MAAPTSASTTPLGWLAPSAESIAGFSGGVCCVYAGLPFEVVKLRLQTSAMGGRAYAGVRDCLAQIVRGEGVRALWRGAVPALASATLENTVLFTANEVVKGVLLDGVAEPALWQLAACGGLAGAASATAICPAELVKCRLQFQVGVGGSAGQGTAQGTKAPLYRGPLHCVLQIVRHEGPQALYKGWLPLLARDIPFNTVFLGSYEAYCAGFRWVRSALATDDSISQLEIVFAGGAAGATAWAVVFPMDVLKSRLQAQASSRSGALAAMVSSIRTEGLHSVFRGYSAAVLRGFPANGALFLGYDLTKKLLGVEGGGVGSGGV